MTVGRQDGIVPPRDSSLVTKLDCKQLLFNDDTPMAFFINSFVAEEHTN